MSAPSSGRKLAAIMFTDMVGYAALVQRNEALAFRIVQQQQRLIRDLLRRFGGREVKTIGDAFLVEFDSALRAIECAVALQQAVGARRTQVVEAERYELRIGLHLGDIERPGRDVFGDSVNIAARLQAQAPPGGIALSGVLYEQVRNHLVLPCVSRGEVALKNMARPVTLFVVEAPAIASADPVKVPDLPAWHHRLRRHEKSSVLITAAVLALGLGILALLRQAPPPSLAVLPFQDLGQDPGGEPFVIGIHEAVLTQLAHVKGIKLISRGSLREYQTRERDLERIGRDLDVAHLVEGSVQQADGRVRVIARMIETDSGRLVWTQSYDRPRADVFALQSELARQIAGAIHAVITPAESARLDRTPTTHAEAYELYLRAVALEYEDRFSARSLARIQTLLEQALALDPAFAQAWALLARVHVFHLDAGYDVSPARLQQAAAAADRALQLQPELAEGHLARGLLQYYARLDYGSALAELDRAISLQPNAAEVHAYRGFVLRRMGRAEAALAALRRAFELDPRNPATVYELAATHAFLHQDQAAHAVCHGWHEKAPFSGDFRLQCAQFAVRVEGTLDPLLALERTLSSVSAPSSDLHWVRFELAVNQGRYTDARQHLSSLSDDDLLAWAGAPPREMWLGDLARWGGDPDLARRHYRVALGHVQRRIAGYGSANTLATNEAFVRALLGRLHAELGERDRALAEIERSRQLLPESRDRFYAVSLTEEIAKAHLRLGDTGTALELLAYLLDRPSHTHINDLRLQRQWSDLWEEPRFHALVATHSRERDPRSSS